MKKKRAFLHSLTCAIAATMVLVVGFCYCSSANAQAFAWYPGSTLTPGGGIQLSNPSIEKGVAVQFDSLEPVDSAAAPTVLPDFDVMTMHNTGDLETFTTFDPTLNANYLFFGGGGNVSWLTDYNFSDTSLVWGLRIYSDFGRYSLKNPVITPDAKQAEIKLADFETAYGDSYVNMVRKGALITVLFNIDDAAPGTIESLSKALGVGLTFGITNGQVTGNLDSFLRQAVTFGSVHVRFISLGVPDMSSFNGTIASDADITKLDGLITNYASQIIGASAVPVVYYTAPYSTLGVATPAPAPAPQQMKLLDLANHYYLAAQRVAKLDSIVSAWWNDYDYIDRPMLSTYQDARAQYAAYLGSLTALAPAIRSSATPVIPDVPDVVVPWPSPEIAFTYRRLTTTDPVTNTVYKYTVLEGTIHRAVVNEILLVQQGTTLYDLTQAQEDYLYLNAHVGSNVYLYNKAFNSVDTPPAGSYNSDSYVMRWVLGSQDINLLQVTVVALDANGKVITTCPLIHGLDKTLAYLPPNHLSE